MMLMDKTSEKLRSKHVRTLELLQKTLDENVELRDQLGRLQKGALHLGQASGTPRSNRAAALEDEIDRLKAEQCAKLLELEDAGKARHVELAQSVEVLQKKALRLQNQVFTLETALHQAKEALKDGNSRWDDERAQLLDENSQLREELHQLRCDANHSASGGNHEQQQRFDTALEQLRDELASVCKRETEAQRQTQSATDRATRLQCELEVHIERLEKQCAETEALSCQAASASEREAALAQQLVELRGRNSALQSELSQLNQQLQFSHAAVHQQQQSNDAAGRLRDAEEQREALVHNNHALCDQIARLHLQLNELMKVSNSNSSGSVFAVHVELKRENQQLRAQVEELKQLQRRFLTTAKKKTMSFPAI